jgi:hypothetical protein
MPIFSFNTGTIADRDSTNGTAFSLDFADNGVNFTISTTLNDDSGPFQNIAAFIPDVSGGYLQISDDVTGVITLDVNATGAPLTNFGGTGISNNISMQLGNVSLSPGSSMFITFVHESITTLDKVFTVTNNDDNRLLSFTATGSYSKILFTSTTNGHAIEVESLTAAITCYLAGTGIATPTGRVAVEDLQPGDQILTADGGTTTVNWLGIRPIDTATATPAKANPICFVAGSLAPNVPSRDLFVSPDHAMDIDGILYNATALVNGRSIYQLGQMPMGGFTYYHIDTGTHELVLAEGAASETYLDAVGRDAFTNGHEAEDTPIIHEMRVPRIVAKRMVPSDVTAALSTRADALGMTMARKVA